MTKENKPIEIGTHLEDGTIVFGFDLATGNPLRLPEKIFAGESDYYKQYQVVEQANAMALHGHTTWTPLSDEESGQLTRVWDQVAPRTQHDDSTPSWWGASYNAGNKYCAPTGRIYRGGDASLHSDYPDGVHPVPIALRGPVQD